VSSRSIEAVANCYTSFILKSRSRQLLTGLISVPSVLLFSAYLRSVENMTGIGLMWNCLQVIDLETSKPLGPNQRGELCVCGPQIMKGYLNDEAATHEIIDDEGWLHTGLISFLPHDAL